LTTLKDRNYLNSKMKKLLAIFNENENSWKKKFQNIKHFVFADWVFFMLDVVART
jgi:hypothetical protein